MFCTMPIIITAFLLFSILNSDFIFSNFNKENYLESDNFTGQDDTLVLVGKIITKSTKTKNKSQVSEDPDYYFKTDKETYFIKISESIYTKDQLERLKKLDNRPNAEYQHRRFKVIVRNGCWDTDQNITKQKNRTGKYIVIIQELRID